MGIASGIYKTGLSVREFLYKKGIKKIRRLPAKVISVGNLTLGGTGKTPAVIALAEEAKKRGLNPCILTRGYKGRAKGPCFVTKGENPILNPCEAGDEAFLMAERLHEIPIIKGKDRYRAGLFALKALKSEIQNPKSKIVFILDDGFQHWALHRDIDVLLIDATNPLENERLFPEGRLREPLNALKRADTIVLTKSDMADRQLIPDCRQASSEYIQKIKKYNTDAPIYRAYYKPTALVSISGEVRSPESIMKKKIYAFAGIANPLHFKAFLISNGADVVKFKRFRDHYSYKQRDIDEIKENASGLDIITTEKDMVKLKKLDLPENISALRIEFSIDEEFYNHIFGGDCDKEH